MNNLIKEVAHNYATYMSYKNIGNVDFSYMHGVTLEAFAMLLDDLNLTIPQQEIATNFFASLIPPEELEEINKAM